jgi:hypothetical protein
MLGFDDGVGTRSSTKPRDEVVERILSHLNLPGVEIQYEHFLIG